VIRSQHPEERKLHVVSTRQQNAERPSASQREGPKWVIRVVLPVHQPLPVYSQIAGVPLNVGVS